MRRRLRRGAESGIVNGMFKSSYQICTVFGIPIRLDFSLIVLFFLLVSQEGDAVYGIATGIVLLVSIVLHELGHSLAAMAFGYVFLNGMINDALEA